MNTGIPFTILFGLEPSDSNNSYMLDDLAYKSGESSERGEFGSAPREINSDTLSARPERTASFKAYSCSILVKARKTSRR